MRHRRVAIILGTRPEAIKLAAVARALASTPCVETRIIATGQHAGLAADALALLPTPPLDLGLMTTAQSPGDFLGRATAALTAELARWTPDIAVVQGDTGSALGGALAAFQSGVPVAHVEAGLRTGDLAAPFPEEGNRRLIAAIAAHHFAPTAAARAALRREGVDPATIHLVGNPGVDTLLQTDRAVRDLPASPFGLPTPPPGHALLLATVHRRENHGPALDRIAAGLAHIARTEAAEIIVPLHPNPAVAGPLRRRLTGVPGIHLVAPLPYRALVWLVRRAALVLTDSGGLQEEAPTLGTPVLILRDTTERPEGVRAGAALVVGTQSDEIAGTARALLRHPELRAHMARPRRLYGRGDAGAKIAATLAAALGLETAPARDRHNLMSPA